MLSLSDPITTLPKTGPKLAQALAAMGIYTIAELLTYFPNRYLDFTKYSDIKDLKVGEIVTVRGIVKSAQRRFSFRSRKSLSEAVISDMSDSLKVVWFNQGYVAENLERGDAVLLSGRVQQHKGIFQLVNPIYEIANPDHIHTGRFVPIYSLPDTIYPKTFRKLIYHALPCASQFEETLPSAVLQHNQIIGIENTITELHFPTSEEQMAKAHERLAFEESFISQLAKVAHQRELASKPAHAIHISKKLLSSIEAGLPYSLTAGQREAIFTIAHDFAHKHPMNRLLQGDVGSGKTIVALMAALIVINAGYQVAFLAPTEVLAKQHFDTILKYLTDYSLSTAITHESVSLFTRNFHLRGITTLSKAKLTEHIKKGVTPFVIGTHALLQESVSFKDLALVVIDEQHRFGVAQRKSLTRFTQNSSTTTRHLYPHLLSMSATPIPRTAALALYGDLDISTLQHLPANRLPIKTWLVPESKRNGAYNFVKEQIQLGKQAFIITPLVEESEKLQVKAAKTEFSHLQKNVFPTYSLGLIYGSMKGAEKDQVMTSFKNGEIDLLVATSVIEIGIDIPNATVIIIEHADRFGLATLHQLRGRVGRGIHQSYCMLFSDSSQATTRLEFFKNTNSGFQLAEYDMQTRGFGSLFGTAQTGFGFTYSKYLTPELVHKTKNAADLLMSEDANLDGYPSLKDKTLSLSQNLHLE